MPRQATDSPVLLGLEACAQSPPACLPGARIGLLFNQASVDSRFRYACDVLAGSGFMQIAALFSPQHGLWGEEQANMIETPHGRHPRFPGVPLYSLYSDTRRPTPEMLKGLDAFVIDLPDVGTRIYTYIWTVTHCLEACAEQGLPVVLLDRPNPLGGEIVEGPVLDPAFASFVGRAPLPMRHGLTIGELALYFNDAMGIGADLTVVRLTGWRRDMLWPETGPPWVAPSPNLPTFASALVYPGQVLLEGTNLSEGRGTTTPFEIVGAPFIDEFRLADALSSRLQAAACATQAEACTPTEVIFRPIRFRPTFDKWAGESCGGVMLHVTDPRVFRPYRTTLLLLAAIKRLWPQEFAWRPPPYEYETKKLPIDILSGSSRLREWIDGGAADDRLPAELIGDNAAADWRRQVPSSSPLYA
jgi:uncharacterized protein YbbC (DUF1343 family)